MGKQAHPIEIFLAGIMVTRHEPLSPHHANAIRVMLKDLTDDEMLEMVRTGKWPEKNCDHVWWNEFDGVRCTECGNYQVLKENHG
jgi:hypothetical protein